MPGDRLTGLLLALAAGLGALVWWQGQRDVVLTLPPAPAPPAVAASPGDEGAASQPSLPPLATLTETVERPLFSAERRPAEATALPAPQPEDVVEITPSSPPPLTLSAVIIEPDRRQALLVPAAGGKARTVLEGSEVDGWTLREVREQSVILVRGEARHELSLRSFEPPPPPAARVAPRRAAPTRVAPGGVRPGAVPIPRPRRPLRGPRRRSLERSQP